MTRLDDPILTTMGEGSERHTLPGDLVRLIDLPETIETRGSLLPIDLDGLPFTPHRLFVVREVPEGTTRGGHAHQRGTQLLVRLAGEIRVEMRAGGNSDTVVLADSRVGLLVPAPVWSSQTYLTPDAVLLVLSSEPYDPSSYIE